ncbi:MAG TPA: TonB-dependent receptor [Gemmatimonadales bacterium]|nr:TonB-dependent receptor [Gemmatimonadales bacterium]
MPATSVSAMSRLHAAGAVLLALTGATRLDAQASRLTGRVTDPDGAPVAGATVSLRGTVLRAATGSQGRYTISDVPAGHYTVTARAIGFAPGETEVTVAAGETVTLDLTLTRAPIELAPINVVVGSRARHTAAEELAVPVDVFTADQIAEQGTTETSQILQSLAPSVNFPRQSVTDATDIARPFTLRGLSPDHTLVLINGWRRHQTAVLNTFAYGMGAGSSGVDLNSIPSGAIERIEVLRDGASAQYGSDAIAGVVNLVMREGRFDPFLKVDAGRYVTDDYPDDGTTVDINGGIGLGVGRGSLSLFGQFLQRDPTNRAWPDTFVTAGTGLNDIVNPRNGRIIQKRNPVPQPVHHWGDGLERDAQTFANFRLPLNPAGTTELYSFGGYSHRVGTGNGFWRYHDSDRNWPEIYPFGFLPEFRPDVEDYSAAGGMRTRVGGWSLDFGASFGANRFDYNLRNTLNASLGPCLDTPCAPGLDGVLGTADDPGIPNQTRFFAGRLRRTEFLAGLNLSRPLAVGLEEPVNLALGAAFRRETYAIRAGEFASWVAGGHLAQDSSGPAPGGSSVFQGFSPSDATDEDRTNFGAYADLEARLTRQVLADVAGRFETYSDFGERVTGKLALRYQPTPRLVLRGALSTGFRAPGLAQSFFSHRTTNVIGGQFVEVGNFPVDHPAARLFGAKPLKEETSVNLSAGFAFTPRDNLTITVDYYRITIDDRILLGATFADSVSEAILADSGFGSIDGVQFFTNGLDTRTQGVDVTADWRVPVGAEGTLTFTAGVNYTKNEITRVGPLPRILQGTPTTLTSILDLVTKVGIEEERPDWRGTLQGNLAWGRFHALGRASYFGKFASAQPSFTDREEYGAKTLFDAEIGYRFNNVDLSVGVRNLFDTYPDHPKAEFNNNDNTFPWAAASPFGYNGRYLYTRAEMALGW